MVLCSKNIKKCFRLKTGTNMINIKITMGKHGFPAQTQLPNMEPYWKDCHFFVNQDIAECDFWIVWGQMYKTESAICPKENVFFISSEPPTIYKYEEKFLRQFNTIITCDKNTKHPNPIYQQQSLPWWLGHDSSDQNTVLPNTTYDALSKDSPIKKEKLISIIVSNKKSTIGHKKRYEFAQKIKQYFGDRIDIFGMGVNECRYKWDAIAPYKYHIVIENSSFDDYWTEKLSDSILAESYSFYYGCKNIDKYFSKDIYTEIDIEDIDSSIRKIETIIQSKKYEENMEEIIKAKHLILNQYQLFPSIYNLCSKLPIKQKKKVTLKPEGSIYKIIQKIKRKYGLTK